MTGSAQGIESLERLLDVERYAIRAGAFDGLAEIVTHKEALIGNLGDVDPENLARLRRKAEVNQRLLLAALKGVRAAQRRLDMIQRASRSLNSYDALGRARTIGSGGPNVERRA